MTGPFDRNGLTVALQAEVTKLVDDLRTRADEVPEVGDLLATKHERAVAAERTAFDLATWREGELAQVAVSWVLGSVFVRFCEDNGLITEPLLSGDSTRRRHANEAKLEFFREDDEHGERAWFQRVFTVAKGMPGLAEVFGDHNPLWQFGPSDDSARALLDFWQGADPETGELHWSFEDPSWDTRFLGDLYQDLSDHAKKQYALLQTPDFVESFILDRTLEPALAEFSLDGHDGEGFRLIDPACGSGHFLLGAFDRLALRCFDRSPAEGRRAAAAKALSMVYGVDINPFAVSIARFRLLIAALRFAGDATTLAEAPNYVPQVATGDSLLAGGSVVRLDGVLEFAEAQAVATQHLYNTEDDALLRRFFGQDYHAVVANPPYITPKDPAANSAYRDRYESCSGKYSLSVPFMERLFQLARRAVDGRPAGFVGQITANSFMKREFGKKLIESYLARFVDLTHVIDLGSLRLPDHTTPTVIMFGRNRSPLGDSLRLVLGIRGERPQPENIASGMVWKSIMQLVDQPNAENEFISTTQADRETLATHPWSLQGGAAGPLKEHVDSRKLRLESKISEIGFASFPGLDDAFIFGRGALRRSGAPDEMIVDFVYGEVVRDWESSRDLEALRPYDSTAQPLSLDTTARWARLLWPMRTPLGNIKSFGGKTRLELGDDWWLWYRWVAERYRTPLSLAFAFVATHNHFVLDRGGKVFNRSAPVIKLETGAGEDEHLQLLGLLNSAVACFWMQQVFQPKPNPADDLWELRYEFDGTKLKQLPVAEGSVLTWSARLDACAQRLGEWLPSSLAEGQTLSAELWAASEQRVAEIRAEMMWLQEELDWRCAHLYGVTAEDLSLPPEQAFALHKGERAFEIALARRMAAGTTESEWFRRHDSSPVTELPGHWPDGYKRVVERRLELIESDRFVNLLERPEYKRRWNWEPWNELADQALVDWLATRLEDPRYWPQVEPRSVAQLADTSRNDADFVQVAELHRGTSDIDYVELIDELMKAKAVPYLAAWRYKPSGLRKRASWEETWRLQRLEDAGEYNEKIPVPPKYGSGDFRSTAIWKARGKLDVPKERFISYPGCERSTDTTPVYGWAGWDHLHQAQAVVALYTHRYQHEGWDGDALTPILAGLGELIPWLRQWHNDHDPAIGMGLGDYYADYHDTQVRHHHLTPDDLTAWAPPTTRRRTKTKTKKS